VPNGIPRFAGPCSKKGIECLLAGDIDTGKAVLPDYIDATAFRKHISAD